MERKAATVVERISPTTIKRARRGFTMVELIVVVAIIGFLIVIVSPKLSWTEPPRRVLQRSLLEAVETSRRGASVRFRAEKKTGQGGAILPEILTKGKDNEAEWVPLKMQYMPIGDRWRAVPEILYFFSDGTCSPARLTYGNPPEQEKFLLTVTGYIVEEK